MGWSKCHKLVDAWYNKLTKHLEWIGFQMSTSGHSLFVLKDKDDIIFVVVYVDDKIIGENTTENIEEVQNMLQEKFKMKELRTLKD